MTRRRPPLASLGVALGSLLCVGQAAAFDWELEARAGFINSDNVAQAPSPLDESATIGTLQVSGLAEHSTRTLFLDAEAVHSYRHFFEDDYDDEQQTQLRGTLEWAPLREYLRISVTDVYGQIALNPSEGLLPSDYENANVLTAGPAFVLPIGLDTRFVLTGEYRRATYEESDVDTERRYGQLALEHDLSRLITLFASASRARIDFDSVGMTQGYDVNSAQAGMNAVGRRTSLGFSAGIDSLDTGVDTFEGLTFQLDLERRLSQSTRVFASARREVTDAADVFALGQISDPALTGIRDVQITAQPLLRSQYRLGWVWEGNRLGLNLQGGYIREEFDRLPLDASIPAGIDRTIRELGAGVTYTFGAGTRLEGSYELLHERLESGLRSDDQFITAAYLQALTGKLGLELRVQQIERTNSPRDFDELRAFVFLRYAFRELRAPRESVFDRAFERRTDRLRPAGSSPVSTGGDDN